MKTGGYVPMGFTPGYYLFAPAALSRVLPGLIWHLSGRDATCCVG